MVSPAIPPSSTKQVQRGPPTMMHCACCYQRILTATPSRFSKTSKSEDLQMAADILRPVYDQTNGSDGFVSIEVSPRLAYDTAGSIAEAQRLWKALNRPSLMVKIPYRGGDSGG